MNADLRAKHDLGSIVGYSYRVYLRNFVPLFLIALTTAPFQMLRVVAERNIDDAAVRQAVDLVIVLPGAFVSLAATGALIFAVNEIASGTTPEFGRSLDAAIERYRALLVSILLAGVLALAAILAFPVLTIVWLVRRDATIGGKRNWFLVLVPGALTLYLAVRWVFTQQAVMLDDKRRWGALDTSAVLIRGLWWRTAGVLLVVGLIEVGPVLLSSIAMLAPPLAHAVIASVVAALVLPFGVIAQTLLYYDLKARARADVPADRLTAAEPDVPREGP